MREMQCSPCPWRWWLRPKLGGSGGGFGRGKGGEGRGAYQQPVCGRGWAEERRQLTGRRRTGSTAAASPAPADSQSGKRKGWHREVVGGLGWLQEVLACGGIGRKGRLPTARTGMDGRRCGLRGDGWCAAFIGRAQRQDVRLNAAVRRPASTCVHREPATDRGTTRSGRVRRHTDDTPS
jgi:hypothetical protein